MVFLRWNVIISLTFRWRPNSTLSLTWYDFKALLWPSQAYSSLRLDHRLSSTTLCLVSSYLDTTCHSSPSLKNTCGSLFTNWNCCLMLFPLTYGLHMCAQFNAFIHMPYNLTIMCLINTELMNECLELHFISLCYKLWVSWQILLLYSIVYIAYSECRRLLLSS